MLLATNRGVCQNHLKWQTAKILMKWAVSFASTLFAMVSAFSLQYWIFNELAIRRNKGGSNEYPQSIFLSRNKKNNVYPCKPQFCYIKVGVKAVNIITCKVCFRDVLYFHHSICLISDPLKLTIFLDCPKWFKIKGQTLSDNYIIR